MGARSARRPGRSTVPSGAPTAMRGTGLVVWAVWGSPSGARIQSALPWSAVTRAQPPMSRTARTMFPTHSSTVSTAAMAAGRTPVWPTMSQLARLQTTRA